MRIAVLGSSKIARNFVEASRHVPDVFLPVACSRKEETGRAFADLTGIPDVAIGIDALLAREDADAVYIATPNVCHYEQAKKSLLAGKHVLLEKPACVTQEQLTELYAIADEKGLVLLEAMKSAHSKGLAAIREAMESIGTIRTAQIDFSQRSSRLDALKAGQLPNIFRADLCAGGLMDLGCYCVSLAAELFGEPSGVLSHVDFLPTGADHSGTVILTYPDKTVTLTYSKAAFGFLGSRICGDEGAVCFDSVSKLTAVRRVANDGRTVTLYDEPDDARIMAGEILDFTRYARGEDADGYAFSRNVSFISARVLDEVRAQNQFPF